jgi:hypothetical protein
MPSNAIEFAKIDESRNKMHIGTIIPWFRSAMKPKNQIQIISLKIKRISNEIKHV